MNRIALALLLSLAAGTTARAEDKLKVVTTIETFADLARQVGGDKVVVESLSHGYQDPHFVEPKPNLVIVLNRADLLVRVGLELEIGWLPPLVLNSRNDAIQVGQPGDLDCSTLIDVLDLPLAKVDRSQGDIHPMGNPHYWLPPVNAVRIARGIADRMGQLRPADRDYFQAQFQKLVADLKSRAPAWDAKAKSLAGTKIVTYHKSWSYVSQWLKLQEVGYVENKPGIPPSPDHVITLVREMKQSGVKLLLMEDFYNRAVAQEIADRAGAKLVPVASDVGARPEIKTYVQLVDALLASLAQ